MLQRNVRWIQPLLQQLHTSLPRQPALLHEFTRHALALLLHRPDLAVPVLSTLLRGHISERGRGRLRPEPKHE
jgi:hypothetical protein